MTQTSPAIRPARVAAVVLTHNRPIMLAGCLAALHTQTRSPDRLIVVDNASEPPALLRPVLPMPDGLHVLRLTINQGAAAGYAAGISTALQGGATHVWLMDDDGSPADPGCLAGLLAAEASAGSALTCPLVCNAASPARLAFPIRQDGRTRFTVAELRPQAVIAGFAHLFNGALISARAFAVIGLPDARLFMRGDEVEFLLRASRAGLRIVTDTRVTFLHPSCDAEIHPILGGAFYAMVPADPVKQWCQFRNRGWIFSRYGMWGWLAADHVRYACYFLARTRDPAGYVDWLRATWAGVLGRLGNPLASRSRPRPADMLEHAS